MRRIALAFASLFALSGVAQAYVVCTNADGQTYATDNPPPGCEIRSRHGNAPAPAPQAEAVAPAPEPPADIEPKPEPESSESRKRHAVTICEQTAAEQMSNPGAVQWPSRDQYKVGEQGRGEFDVEGYVQTQSPLGEVRRPWSCRAVVGGDRWSAQVTFGEESAQSTASAPKLETHPQRETGSWHETSSAREAPPSAARGLPPGPTAGRAPGNAGNCPSVRFRETYAERYPNQGYQLVKGTIENSGSRPIYNVRVCASGVCSQVRGESPMEKGATESFSVKVPSLATATVTAECAIIAESM